MLHTVAAGNLSTGEKSVAEGKFGVGKRRKANTDELSNLKTAAISDQQFVDSIEEVEENEPAAKRSRSLNFWSLEEDTQLLQMMQNTPPLTWNEMANQLVGRSATAIKAHAQLLLKKLQATSSTGNSEEGLEEAGAEDQDDAEEAFHDIDAAGGSRSKTSSWWTKEEDTQLENMLLTLPTPRNAGAGGGFWESVVPHFPHRSRCGVISRARRLISRLPHLKEAMDKNAADLEEAKNAARAAGHDVNENGEKETKVKILWTYFEEEKLLQLMGEQQGPRCWDEIAKHFPGRNGSAVQCHGVRLQRQIRRMSASAAGAVSSGGENSEADEDRGPKEFVSTTSGYKRRRKIMWSLEEEETLIIAMQQTPGRGKAYWTEIAKLFPHRAVGGVEVHGKLLVEQLAEKRKELKQLEQLRDHQQVQDMKFRKQERDILFTGEPLRRVTTEDNDGDDEENNGGDNEDNADNASSDLLTIFREMKSSPLLPLVRRKVPRSKTWTAEEDDALRKAMIRYPGNHWAKVSGMIPGENKTPQQCLGRWRALNPSVSRSAWTPEEDTILREAVQTALDNGEKIRWSKIALSLPQRRDTQCRSRWCYVLNPEINTTPWTDDELVRFLLARHQLGSRWTEIQKLIPGRSINSLMSRWHSSKRRIEGYLLLKLGTTKEALLEDFENYDFESFFLTVPFSEEDAREVVAVMQAGSFVGYKVTKSLGGASSSPHRAGGYEQGGHEYDYHVDQEQEEEVDGEDFVKVQETSRGRRSTRAKKKAAVADDSDSDFDN